MSQIFRTKFKREIICEFLPPAKPSNKVMILLMGLPVSGPTRNERMIELSKKGYWVFLPRYRGTWESGGKLFSKSPHLDVLDVIDGIHKEFKELWEGEKFKIKNPEIYLIGSSFGGPAALLCSKDKRVKKVIVFSPVIDWREEKNTVEPIPKMAKFVKEAFGRAYDVAPGGWKKIEKGKIYNPATETDKVNGNKCLIFHAKDDVVVSKTPLKKFVEDTGATLKLFRTGGHLGMALLEPKFLKFVFKWLKG